MKENMIFSRWALNWLETVRGTVKSNTFEATYRNTVVNHLNPQFGDRQLNDIKPFELQQFLNRSSEKYCYDMVKKFKSCLNQIFNEAVYNDFCEKNPCYRLKIAQPVTYDEKEVYTAHQMELIQAYAEKHRFGLEIMILCETGMRRGELLGLTWSNIDIANKVIHIRQAASIVTGADGKKTVELGPPKNRTSIRDIPISTIFATYLTEVKKTGAHKTGFVISNSKGAVCNPRTWQRRHYDVFMKEMQHHYITKGVYIPIHTPHNLRHSRASIWVNSGLNLYAVAKALGHADLDMLRKRYAHSDIDELRQLLKII